MLTTGSLTLLLLEAVGPGDVVRTTRCRTRDGASTTSSFDVRLSAGVDGLDRGLVSGWRKCDTCRKVRSTDDFDGDGPTCTPCRTSPVPVARTRTTTVVRRQAPRPAPVPASEAGPRRPLLGTVGSGDLEVRERRARRAAAEALTESHAQEFALLLRDARAAEGLRPLGVVSPLPDGEEQA